MLNFVAIVHVHFAVFLCSCCLHFSVTSLALLLVTSSLCGFTTSKQSVEMKDRGPGGEIRDQCPSVAKTAEKGENKSRLANLV